MSGFCSRLINTEETVAVATTYRDVSEDTIKTIMNVEMVNEDMMNNWFGEGGDSFTLLASTIEYHLLNSCRFSSNSSDALSDMVANFELEDAVRGSSIEASTTGEGENDG